MSFKPPSRELFLLVFKDSAALASIFYFKEHSDVSGTLVPMAASDSHSAVVGEDGSLFVWGSGRRGKLGTGDERNRCAPTRVEGLPAPIRQVCAGFHSTGLVTDDGDLLLCGSNMHGALGLGDEENRTTPTLVVRALFDGDAVLMVACGEFFTAALTERGGVYTFGNGGQGQYGVAEIQPAPLKSQLVPRQVLAAFFNDERVVMLAAGCAHTVALTEQGNVYTWGNGTSGQLGHGSNRCESEPQQVDPGRLKGRFKGEKVVFVVAGGMHTAAVTAGGRLYTWGYGEDGELGHGDGCTMDVPIMVAAGAFGGSAVVMVACGYEHTLVVTHDGALWACGAGEYGQLGLNDKRARLTFERVKLGGLGGAKIVTAVAGWTHSAAVTEDGELWTWGAGAAGQLGHGDKEDRMVPTLVAAASFGGRRIGRGRGLPAEHALAFAMGTHGRLGGGADAHCSVLAAEPGLVGMIVGMCGGRLGRRVGCRQGCAEDGLRHLCY